MVSKWCWAIGLLLALVFAVAGGAIVDLMTTATDVRAAARDFLIYMALTPVFSAAPFMLDGIFIGATRTGDMRDMMILSAVIYFGAALALMPMFGNHGLWIALLISFVARGVTLAVKYPALERSIGR